MGMIRLLVALYPRKWRDSFGEEFTALLEDACLTPRAVFGVVARAGQLHAQKHQRLAFTLALLLWSGGTEYLSVHARLTANILWAPTTPARALALAATIGPWLALAWVTFTRRHGGGRDAAAGGTTP